MAIPCYSGFTTFSKNRLSFHKCFRHEQPLHFKKFQAKQCFFIVCRIFHHCRFSFNSCSKDVDDSIPKPIATLIKSIKSDNPDCTCDPYIAEYFWQNKTVYLRGFTGPTCNWIPIYYDSTGSILTMPANYTPNDFQEESSFIKTVWSCQQH
jgi:hypothetical protein